LVRAFAVLLHYAPAHALGGGGFLTAPQTDAVAQLEPTWFDAFAADAALVVLLDVTHN
jgi:hypothetical protein